MSDTVDLETLERRVIARYMDKCNVGREVPDPIDWSSDKWADDWAEAMSAQASQVPQFPREQWIVHPNRRHYTLLIADRMLDFWDDLDEKQRTDVSILLSFGGRERIA